MYKKLGSVLLTLCLICIYSGAQDFEAGLFSSPKGFGVSLCLNNTDGKSASLIQLFADTAGMFDGKVNSPGIKLAYDYQYNYCQFGKHGQFSLFTGPGISLGYLKDRIDTPHGFMTSLNFINGISAYFNRGVRIELSFTLEVGLHAKSTADMSDNKSIAIYRNGFRQCYFPQLSVFKTF